MSGRFGKVRSELERWGWSDPVRSDVRQGLSLLLEALDGEVSEGGSFMADMRRRLEYWYWREEVGEKQREIDRLVSEHEARVECLERGSRFLKGLYRSLLKSKVEQGRELDRVCSERDELRRALAEARGHLAGVELEAEGLDARRKALESAYLTACARINSEVAINAGLAEQLRLVKDSRDGMPKPGVGSSVTKDLFGGLTFGQYYSWFQEFAETLKAGGRPMPAWEIAATRKGSRSLNEIPMAADSTEREPAEIVSKFLGDYGLPFVLNADGTWSLVEGGE